MSAGNEKDRIVLQYLDEVDSAELQCGGGSIRRVGSCASGCACLALWVR